MTTSPTRKYGWPHQQRRASWANIVAAGQAHCHATHCLHPTRTITPGTPWDLGHTPDRTAWTGPEHATCNRADGARRGNRARRHPHTRTHPRRNTPLPPPLPPPPPPLPSRPW